MSVVITPNKKENTKKPKKPTLRKKLSRKRNI